jgi:HisA/HisF family protein
MSAAAMQSGNPLRRRGRKNPGEREVRTSNCRSEADTSASRESGEFHLPTTRCENRLKILPVLDLKQGTVVRGVAGRRDEYRPIVSRVCADTTPGGVARDLREAFGCDECYVADLDAIAGGEPNRTAFDSIRAAGLRPWIDAGSGTVERAAALATYFETPGIDGRIVVGLESLANVAVLRDIVAAVGAERLTFSLDLHGGRPWTESPAWSSSPEKIAAEVAALGVRSLIVLDVAGVGVGAGVPTLELCRRLSVDHPLIELVSGGGVRGLDDLQALRDVGCSAALVASALHDGRLSRADLDSLT